MGIHLSSSVTGSDVNFREIAGASDLNIVRSFKAVNGGQTILRPRTQNRTHKCAPLRVPGGNSLVPRPGMEQYATTTCSTLPITLSGSGGLVASVARQLQLEMMEPCFHTPKYRNPSRS